MGCIKGVCSVLATKRSHSTILVNSSNVLRYICSAMFYLWDNTCHLASCQWTQSASPFVIQLAWFTTYFSPCATCHDSFFHWCSWIQVSFEHTCSPFTCSPQNVCNDQTDDVDVFSMVDLTCKLVIVGLHIPVQLSAFCKVFSWILSCTWMKTLQKALSCTGICR